MRKITVILLTIVALGCQRETVTTPELQAERQFDDARKLYYEGNYSGSEAALRGYIKTLAKFSGYRGNLDLAYVWLGNIALLNKDYAASEAYYREAIENTANPFIGENAGIGVAEAMKGRGQYQSAIDVYKQYDRPSMNYSHDKVLFGIAMCYDGLNDEPRREHYLERIEKEYPYSRFIDVELDQSTHYTLEIGVYQNQLRAQLKTTELERHGIDSYVKKIEEKTGVLYGVYVGPYADMDEAGRMIERLISLGLAKKPEVKNEDKTD